MWDDLKAGTMATCEVTLFGLPLVFQAESNDTVLSHKVQKHNVSVCSQGWFDKT